VKEANTEGALDDSRLVQGGASNKGASEEETSTRLSAGEGLDSTRGALPWLNRSTLALF